MDKATQDYLNSLLGNQPQSFNMTAPENIIQPPVQAPAPIPPQINPVVSQYLKQKSMAPVEQPQQKPIPPPPVVDQYSDEERKKVLKQAEEQKSGLGLAQFAAGMGQALAGKGPESVNAQFDKYRQNIDEETIGRFEKGKLSQAEKEKVVNYLKQQQIENAFKEKSLAENIASRREMAQMNREAQKASAMEKASKMKELSGEEKKRYDSVIMGDIAVKDMESALKAGQNTFSLVGDNDFTEANRRFVEALARLQSGGAISEAEMKNFSKMAPTAGDSKQMQFKKLNHLKEEFARRINTFGKNVQQPMESKINSEDQQAIDWANANTNDPRAQQILKIHGM